MKKATLLLATATLAPIATAQQPTVANDFGPQSPKYHIRWENDSWGTESDRFYTNGFELGATFRANEKALTWLPFIERPKCAAHVIALGQDMYTPEDFRIATPDPRDRPYAGWLHASYRAQAITLGADRRDHLDTWELELGVVGPSSLAEDVQIRVHEIVGADRPNGWSHQLKDEPGILLGYERRFRTWHKVLPIGESDLIGVLGARLGNVETSARLGTTVRWGFNLPRHFGTAMRPASNPCQRFNLEFGVVGRAVFRNIFLDGNSWRTGPSVDRNKFVADFHVGAVWEFTRRLRFSVRQFWQTPEFDSPSQNGDLVSFTSVQLEWLF